MTLTRVSSAFTHHGSMPARLTCDGRDLPPELHGFGLPMGTRSLALIVDDPDAPDPAAPRMTWVHWVLYNIPPSATGLAALDTVLPELGQPTKAALEQAMQGHVLASPEWVGTYQRSR